jgi:catechol 2,3-dioxygenase-like lactoylglutathione lyase family enzyme
MTDNQTVRGEEGRVTPTLPPQGSRGTVLTFRSHEFSSAPSNAASTSSRQPPCNLARVGLRRQLILRYSTSAKLLPPNVISADTGAAQLGAGYPSVLRRERLFWVNTPIITASDAEGAGSYRDEYRHGTGRFSPRLLLRRAGHECRHGPRMILTFAADGGAAPQVSVAKEGGSGTQVPDISIEVDNLDEIYERVRAGGFSVEYGPVNEPWGVRRFYVRAPAQHLDAWLMGYLGGRKATRANLLARSLRRG